MQIQAISNSFAKHLDGLGTIAILLATAFHPTFLMDDSAFDDAIPDGLANNVLRILLRIEVELQADIT